MAIKEEAEIAAWTCFMIYLTVAGLSHCLASALSSWLRTLPTVVYPIHLSELNFQKTQTTGLEHSERMDEPGGRHIVIRAGAELLELQNTG